MDAGRWSQKGTCVYLWAHRYPGSKITLGGFQTRLKRAVLLPGARTLPFKQEKIVTSCPVFYCVIPTLPSASR